MKYNKILVPTDGSEFGDMAEKRGLKLANEIGAELVILTVADTKLSSGFRYNSSSKTVAKAIIEESEEVIAHSKELAKEYPDLDVDFKMIEGHPATIILDTLESEGCDLIIIGSSGRSALNKFVMGSVAGKVVSHANCDVLVVHKIV